MFAVRQAKLPPDALLQKYVASGDYTDCFVAEMDRQASFADYIEAFYTTCVFKAERAILKWAVSKPSTDAEAHCLAAGALASFAAWQVEERGENQLLLTDFRGRTRSWLMLETGEYETSRLFFGSAVIRDIEGKTGKQRLSQGFGLLLGFHKLYSRILLSSARSRLLRMSS